jgi:hypothetical protein
MSSESEVIPKLPTRFQPYQKFGAAQSPSGSNRRAKRVEQLGVHVPILSSRRFNTDRQDTGLQPLGWGRAAPWQKPLLSGLCRAALGRRRGGGKGGGRDAYSKTP